jgi:hypothetical protein
MPKFKRWGPKVHVCSQLRSESKIAISRKKYDLFRYPIDHANPVVFASGFKESDSTIASQNSNDSFSQIDNPPPLRRRRISMVEDFDIVHSILYYIYTNRVTFSTIKPDDSQEEGRLPRICPTEDIYALAHRFDLDSLQAKALGFLEKTCTLGNATQRTFSKFASLYDEVGEVYNDYFMAKWKNIRKTPSFEEYFSTLEDEEDHEETARVFKAFRMLMKRAEFRCPA